MISISLRPRSPRFALLVAAAAAAFGVQQTGARAASPFEKFTGEWRGGGQILESNGRREPIRCRAEYSEAKDGAALNQAIVCASESFKLDIKTYVEASAGLVQGYWTDATRDVSGHLTGRIEEGRFEGEISAAAFGAYILLTSNGRRQAVSIKPRSGDVSDVRIDLKREG